MPISPERPPPFDEVLTLSEAALLALPYMPVNGRAHKPVRRGLRVLGLSLAVVLVGGIAAAVAFDQLSINQFLPGTHIGGVKVGSRSVDDAAALLERVVVTPLRTQAITLNAPRINQTAPAWRLGVRVEVAAALRSALAQQQSGPLIARMWRRFAGDAKNFPLPTVVDQARLRAYLGAAAQRIDRPPRDATVEIHGETLKVIPHQIGRRLDVPAAQNHLVTRLGMGDRLIKLPVEVTEPQLRTEQFAKVVLVRTGSKHLDLYVEGKVFKSYPVATGSPGYATPHGQFTIVAKRRNPGWGNPGAPWSMNMPAYIPPGPGNPLGTRALNLSISGIRIHGTPNSGSIGRAASHGCIRMFMNDAEELFDLVDVGTPVVVVGA